MTLAHPSKIFLPLVMTLAAFAATVGCESSENDSEIQALAETTTAALERGRLEPINDATTDNFIAHPGKLSKAGAMRSLFNLLRLHKQISVLHPELDIEQNSDGKTAVVKTPFLALPGRQSPPALEKLSADPEAWRSAAARLGQVQIAEISLIKVGTAWKADSIRFY